MTGGLQPPPAAESGKLPGFPAFTMHKLSDFSRIQEPRVEGSGGRDIQNVSDMGGGVVRFRLRIGKTWWDGDGAGGAKGGRSDRQRAECRSLGGPGAALQRPGEIWEYGTTFRTSTPFVTWNGALTMIMQLMPPSELADKSVQLLPVVACQLTSDRTGQFLLLDARKGMRTVRTFSFVPGEWTTLRYRVKVDATRGSAMVSVNDDAFQGLQDVPASRGASKGYDAKFGFYRHFSSPKKVCDDYVEHKGCYRRLLTQALKKS